MRLLMIDPEFENLLPPLSKEEFINLKKSLNRDGCRDALIAWNGTLIDGHNRYRIIENMKKHCHYDVKEMAFESKEDAMVWVIDNQNTRRNIRPIDLVKMKEKKYDILQRQAKERQGARTDLNIVENLPQSEPGKTRDKAAAEIGISGKTYDALVKVNKKAIPEVVEAVRGKRIGASTAAKIAEMPKEKQVEIISKGPKSAIQEVKKMAKQQEDKQKPVQTNEPTKASPIVSWAMDFAEMAISQLERINKKDPKRAEALNRVASWISKNLKE